MHEVPRLQTAFLAFDEQDALAVEHEEVLLRVLAVVHAVRLTRVQHLDVDPELRKARVVVTLERHRRAECGVVPPAGLAGVDDEPAVAARNESALGLLQLRFFGHAYLRVCARGFDPKVVRIG
jgi:hypothetical protein